MAVLGEETLAAVERTGAVVGEEEDDGRIEEHLSRAPDGGSTLEEDDELVDETVEQVDETEVLDRAVGVEALALGSSQVVLDREDRVAHELTAPRRCLLTVDAVLAVRVPGSTRRRGPALSVTSVELSASVRGTVLICVVGQVRYVRGEYDEERSDGRDGIVLARCTMVRELGRIFPREGHWFTAGGNFAGSSVALRRVRTGLPRRRTAEARLTALRATCEDLQRVDFGDDRAPVVVVGNLPRERPPRNLIVGRGITVKGVRILPLAASHREVMRRHELGNDQVVGITVVEPE